MKITVTTSVRVEQESGDSSTATETVRESCGDNPRFIAYEVDRVIAIADERVLEHFGGEAAVAAIEAERASAIEQRDRGRR